MKIITSLIACLSLGASLLHASSTDTIIGRYYLTQKNLPYANSMFAQGSDAEAKTLKALTSIALLQRDSGTVTFLNNLYVDSPANIWDARDVGYSPNPSQPNPFRAQNNANVNQIAGILRNNHLPVYLQAETDLSAFTSDTLLVPLGQTETGYPTISLDRGDILMIRALLACGRGVAYLINSQNSSILINEFVSLTEEAGPVTIEKFLAKFPDAGKLANPSDLPLARQEFKNSITRYKEASEWIRTKRTFNTVRLFNLPGSFGVSSGEVYTAGLADEAAFRTKLDEYALLLDGSRLLTGFDNKPIETLNAQPFFDGLVNLRSILPSFRKNKIRQGEVTDAFAKAGGIYPANTIARTESWLLGETVKCQTDPYAFGLFVPPHISMVLPNPSTGAISEGKVATPAPLFIERDFKVPGDKAITLDVTTNLEWLDISYTIAKTREYVIANSEPEGLYDGFRHATRSEIEILLRNFGIELYFGDPNNNYFGGSTDNISPFDSFLSKLGVTYVGWPSSYKRSHGFSGTYEADGYFSPVVGVSGNYGYIMATRLWNNQWGDDVGHYLVRQNMNPVVPSLQNNKPNLKITRSGDLSESIPVVLTFSGSATPSSDYLNLFSLLTLNPQDSSEYFLSPFEVLDDATPEFDETIIITGTPSQDSEATFQPFTLTIQDDDGSGVGIVATDNVGKEGRMNPDPFGFRFGVYDPIRFEVRRTGSTASAISVKVSRDALLSSASTDDYEINGFDVDGQSVRIPAGSSSAEIVVSPKYDISYPEGTESVTLKISPDSAYTLMEYSSATGSIVDASPYEWWSYQMGVLVSNQSPSLDTDNDGMANLLEMALGRDPNLPDSPDAIKQGLDSEGYLTLTYRRWTGGITSSDGSYNQYGVTYRPQASSTLELASWSSTYIQVRSITDTGDGMEEVVVRDTQSKSQPRRFLRLQVVSAN